MLPFFLAFLWLLSSLIILYIPPFSHLQLLTSVRYSFLTFHFHLTVSLSPVSPCSPSLSLPLSQVHFATLRSPCLFNCYDDTQLAHLLSANELTSPFWARVRWAFTWVWPRVGSPSLKGHVRLHSDEVRVWTCKTWVMSSHRWETQGERPNDQHLRDTPKPSPSHTHTHTRTRTNQWAPGEVSWTGAVMKRKREKRPERSPWEPTVNLQFIPTHHSQSPPSPRTNPCLVSLAPYQSTNASVGWKYAYAPETAHERHRKALLRWERQCLPFITLLLMQLMPNMYNTWSRRLNNEL